MNWATPTTNTPGVCGRRLQLHVDRFSHLVIFAAAHCLLGGNRDLWRRFNNDENLLFREQGFPAARTVRTLPRSLGDERPECSADGRPSGAGLQATAGRSAVARSNRPGWAGAGLDYVEQQAAASLMAGERVAAGAVARWRAPSADSPAPRPPRLRPTSPHHNRHPPAIGRGDRPAEPTA